MGWVPYCLSMANVGGGIAYPPPASTGALKQKKWDASPNCIGPFLSFFNGNRYQFGGNTNFIYENFF